MGARLMVFLILGGVVAVSALTGSVIADAGKVSGTAASLASSGGGTQPHEWALLKERLHDKLVNVDASLSVEELPEKNRRAFERQRQRLERALLYIDIGLATGPERRRLIRQLPVRVQTVTVGGNHYREYSARGRAPLRVPVPTKAPTPAAAQLLEEPDGSKPGESAPPSCYYEDEDGAFSGDCVTQQDLDDAFIIEADMLAEEEQMVMDAEQVYSDMVAYCLNYSCDSDALPASGPNMEDACVPESGECLYKAGQATFRAGQAVWARSKLSALMRSGGILTVATSALAAKVAGATVAIAASAYFTYQAIECYGELN